MLLKKRTATKERLARVAKLYLAYKFLGALYFTYPIFYQFAVQSITPIQVGFFFSAIGIVGFLAEIPTGVIADKYGRKLSGVLGMATLSMAPLIVFFGHTFSAYLIAALFYGLGRALLSGALESLVYDHKSSSEEMYRKINALEISFGQAGILVGAATGGALFSFEPSLPFITEAATGIVCTLLIACMQEQNKSNFVKSTATHRQHFTDSMKYLFATPFLRVFVFSGALFSVMLGICIQFANEAAMIEHGFQPEVRGFIISGTGIVTLVILHFVILKLAKNDVTRIIYLMSGAAIAYTVMSINNTPLFLLGYLLWSCLNATSSFIRVMLHDRIPGSHRATIISNFKALATLVGLVTSTATGLLIQKTGTPRAVYTVLGTVACLFLLPCAFWLIKHINNMGNPSALLDSD
jgi:MFS family permease